VLCAFGEVLLGSVEIVLRGRGKEVFLQSSDASIEVVSGHGLSVRAVANSFQTTTKHDAAGEAVVAVLRP
jgi:hypothetical protein